jgi:hypothetical protein
MSSSSKSTVASVVVRNNAPNWPAMVRRTKETAKSTAVVCLPPIAGTSSVRDLSSSSSTSLLLQAKRLKSDIENNSLVSSSIQLQPTSLRSKEKFAAKSTVVRQCPCCQKLFSNFHQCSDM